MVLEHTGSCEQWLDMNYWCVHATRSYGCARMLTKPHQQPRYQLATRDRHTRRPSDNSLLDHSRPGAPQEPSRINAAARKATSPYEPCFQQRTSFRQRARPHDCPSTQNRKRRPFTMGNGASCGENARDVGVDEELNPMLMGDADKENHYRRPSVPHVQAVLRQRPPVITAFF